MDEAALSLHVREPLFYVSWEHERAGPPIGLDRMLELNADDPEFCQWLRTASIGSEYRAGGGCSPLCIVRRAA